MTESFSAQVNAYVSETIERSTAVFKQSAQDVIEDAQAPRPSDAYNVSISKYNMGKSKKLGRMRVDTGFLRNSHVSGLNGSTSLSGADSYVLTIAGAKLGDSITGGWTADYAIPREFGARGQAPDFFARGAAQKWQQFVDANSRKLMKG